MLDNNCRKWIAVLWIAMATAPWPSASLRAAEPAATEPASLEGRVANLEARVAAAEAAARDAAARAEQAAAAASVKQRSINAFNPAVGLTLQGGASHFTRGDGARPIPGFLSGPGGGVGSEGLWLGESELSLDANVDNKLYGMAIVSFSVAGGESAVDVEEVYLQTLEVPRGFTVRAGQFFSNVGYQNARHSHVWDFVDQPLFYEAMLDNQYIDPGLRVSWVAPTDTYIELGAEAYRGDRFPAAGAADHGVGVKTGYLHVGGDVGDSNSWQANLGALLAKAAGRQSGDADGPPTAFSGNSDVGIAGVVWKWSPHGDYHRRNVVAQAEYAYRRERGALTLLDPAAAPGLARSGPVPGRQSGWYAQAVYQFIMRWRIGARFDQLLPDDSATGLAAATSLATGKTTPWRATGMLDFSNSEFSRLRLQYNYDAAGTKPQNEFYLQYIVSIGAHGAHQF